MGKERAILERFVTRLEASLAKLSERAKEGKIRDREKTERQIGRLLERNSRASSIFEVTIKKEKKGKRGARGKQRRKRGQARMALSGYWDAICAEYELSSAGDFQ